MELVYWMRASVDLRHSPEVVYSNRAELGCLLPALANGAQVGMFGTPAIAPIQMTRVNRIRVMASISLDYGTTSCWHGEIDDAHLLWQFNGPPALLDVVGTITEDLQNPLDFPALRQALV